MKNLSFFIILLLFVSTTDLIAQEAYIVNGDTLQLKVELKGDLDFLSKKSKNNYRFFVKDKNDTIFELLNTKQGERSYSKEYKIVLNKLTEGSNMSTNNLGFGHYSLKQFIRAYNSNGTKRYTYTGEKVYMQSRIGVFGGITNYPFVDIDGNGIAPFISMELELFAKIPKPKQTGYFSIGHTFENSKIKYTATQLGIGYRYRFINQSRFNIHGDLRIANYTFSKKTFVMANSTEVVNEALFFVPFSFGIGSDIKISDSSFITLTYNELFALFITNSNSFPVNFSLGYKFSL